MNFIVREMGYDDFNDVINIECCFFAKIWKRRYLSKRLGSIRSLQWVAQTENRVVGYVFCTLSKMGLEIDRLAVHSDFHHQSVGSKLVEQVKKEVLFERCKTKRVTVFVPETNVGVQKFFKTLSIPAIKVAKGHYDSEDAYLFQWAATTVKKEFLPTNRISHFMPRVEY